MSDKLWTDGRIPHYRGNYPIFLSLPLEIMRSQEIHHYNDDNWNMCEIRI